MYKCLNITYKQRTLSGVAVRGEDGVAGEGRWVGEQDIPVVGATKELTRMHSDWMSNISLDLNVYWVNLNLSRILGYESHNL